MNSGFELAVVGFQAWCDVGFGCAGAELLGDSVGRLKAERQPTGTGDRTPAGSNKLSQVVGSDPVD